MHSAHRGLLVLALVLGACAPQHSGSVSHTPRDSATNAASLAAELGKQAPLWLAQHDVPSIAVAYIQDGAVQWTQVHGEQAKGVPATPETLYNVASLAKPISAETMLRLVARDRLSLDEPLAAYWVDPDLANDPRHERLTLRLALSHQTGFPNWRYQTAGVLQFQREPGGEFGYSGEGYEYAKRFVEEKLAEPWESLASHFVFEPFGMTNTAYTQRDWFADRIAMPYGPEGEYGEPSIRESAFASDDVYTTIGDYSAFLVGVMNRDGLPAVYAAQRDSIHVVNARATANCNSALVTYCPRVGMGLGWEIIEYPGETVRRHGGSDWGEFTMAFYIAERRAGAVMFTNGAEGLKVVYEAINLLFPHTYLAEHARSRR